MDSISIPNQYASADEPSLRDVNWLEQQWNTAREQAKKSEAILVLDEIQKVTGWSEVVKHLWDEDTWNKISLKVVLTSMMVTSQSITKRLKDQFCWG